MKIDEKEDEKLEEMNELPVISVQNLDEEPAKVEEVKETV